MKLMNLTPHEIVVVGDGGAILARISPSGQVARVSVRNTPDAEASERIGLPVSRQETGEVAGLPEEQAGEWLIVSLAVRAACPGRADLLSPGELIRNEAGQPIGCRGLVGNGGAA